MKNLRPHLIELLQVGNCTPRISELSKKLNSLSTTVHYNIKQMEAQGVIRAYKAVFDYKKIDEGFCSYELIKVNRNEGKIPEDIGLELAKYAQIESVDIVTGEWSLMVKVRSKDIDSYYEFIKKVSAIKGIASSQSINSLKQIKTEFVKL